jgi:hypothetical protein
MMHRRGMQLLPASAAWNPVLEEHIGFSYDLKSEHLGRKAP